MAWNEIFVTFCVKIFVSKGYNICLWTDFFFRLMKIFYLISRFLQFFLLDSNWMELKEFKKFINFQQFM